MKTVSIRVYAASALCAATMLAGTARASSGTLSGIVQSASTGQPLSNGFVSLTINGAPWGATAPVDGSGGFNFGTVVWVGASANCQLQIDGSGLVSGSALESLAPGGSVYAFINRAGSTISGTVTDSSTGNPLSGGSVLVYDSGGALLGAALQDAQGHYRFGGLTAGTYYVRTDFAGYLDELWNNIPCTNGDCSVTAGTPTVLADQVSDSAADFAIEPNLIFSDDFGG